MSLAVSQRLGKRQAEAMQLSCFSDCVTESGDVFSALTLLHISAAFDTVDISSSSQRSLLCTDSAFPGTPFPSPWDSFTAWALLLVLSGAICPPPRGPLPVTVGLHARALLSSRQLLLTLPPGWPPGFLTQSVRKLAPEASALHPPGLGP